MTIIKTGIFLSTINRTCFGSGKRAGTRRYSNLFEIVVQKHAVRAHANRVLKTRMSLKTQGHAPNAGLMQGGRDPGRTAGFPPPAGLKKKMYESSGAALNTLLEIGTIERPVLHTFRDMRGVDLLDAGQIGDRARHFQDAVVRARRECETLDRRHEQPS